MKKSVFGFALTLLFGLTAFASKPTSANKSEQLKALAASTADETEVEFHGPRLSSLKTAMLDAIDRSTFHCNHLGPDGRNLDTKQIKNLAKYFVIRSNHGDIGQSFPGHYLVGLMYFVKGEKLSESVDATLTPDRKSLADLSVTIFMDYDPRTQPAADGLIELYQCGI
jgi:hypothetical protein